MAETSARPVAGEAAVARTASVGVDVDSLHHYYRIHGLDPAEATNAAWTVGVPRFVELFESLGVPATFYCIAEDLAVEDNEGRVRDLAARGFEIGNHTLTHPYELTRLRPEHRRREIGEGRDRLEAGSGFAVSGFRAPGYNTNAGVLADARATGHRYDSSVFPCVPYYVAKAGVLGLMRLRGRASRSIMGSPRTLLAPRDPYVSDVASPYRPGGGGLPEFPISVAGGVPLIGTAFTALGRRLSLAALEVGLRLHTHLTLEFHAVDLMSIADDGLEPSLGVQGDLRASVARKRAVFEAVLERLRDRARVERLCDLAPGAPA